MTASIAFKPDAVAADQDRGHPLSHLRAALAQMSAGMIVLDDRGRILFANESAQTIFGLPQVTGESLDLAVLLDAGLSGGSLRAEQLAALRDNLSTLMHGRSVEPLRLELGDGRAISVHCDPVPEGGWVLILNDVTRHFDAEIRAQELARRDPLTNLPNRLALHERLTSAVERAIREGESVAVLCPDLDHFKTINDTLGHPLGDALLQKVAERLQSIVRDTDLVTRTGGDEFAILQIGAEQPSAAAVLAQRLVDLIGRVYVAQGHMMNVGASVGVALTPHDGASPDELLKNADLALYRAKADGRNGFRSFEREMDVRMQNRRSLEIELRKALALGELEVHYQPQMHLESHRIVGFEALLRWNNAARGLVSPAEFVPLAEEIGLIIPIGDWVLRTACQEAANWAEPLSIAVNLSAVQFKSANLFATVASALANSRLAPERLELEITEGVLLHDTPSTLALLHQFRGLGLRISLDDFGTGYSSLSYLQKFPFDKIKIDQSFVRKMTSDPDCAAIVRAVAGLGASLRMKTTAEGVETQEQLDQIRAEGCSEIQGFLLSHAVPANQIAELLTRTLPSRAGGDATSTPD